MILLGHDFSYESNKDKIYSGSSKLVSFDQSIGMGAKQKIYYFLNNLFFFYKFDRDPLEKAEYVNCFIIYSHILEI